VTITIYQDIFVNLIIDGNLCEPPSSVSCFRDITFWAKIFSYEDVILCCDIGTRVFYRNWLRRNGAYDFISYIMYPEEGEDGVWLVQRDGRLRNRGVPIDKISAENYWNVIDFITLDS